MRILATTTERAHPKRKQSGSVESLLLRCGIQHHVLQQAGAGAEVLCHLLFWLANIEAIHPVSPCCSNIMLAAVLEGGQPKRQCAEKMLCTVLV